eukprot:Protomagalhaensia_wolfi_Nauph_80__24@NODE_1015_length_1808_cov_117_815715_g768_i0_p2_GENE_NODE_1015_length_1808_cov_117_815715_g768_i0NODE_1015_length_1808_cov_117_815715_g768_i0_p2_ORF_typecomplete_len221_score57_06Nop16/PF09420_10/5_7e11Nop16/PF09420_10/3_4e03_NODE_1015_length_1808_cov_117_815715_g768_i047709
MVGHKKVSRKVKKETRKLTKGEKNKKRKIRPIKSQIKDPKVRQLWDPKKPPSANFESIPATVFSDRLPDEHTTKTSPLGELDAAIVKKLIARFGNNVERMAKDHKINRWQWTEGQLNRKLALYNQGHLAKDLGEKELLRLYNLDVQKYKKKKKEYEAMLKHAHLYKEYKENALHSLTHPDGSIDGEDTQAANVDDAAKSDDEESSSADDGDLSNGSEMHD